MKTKKLILEKLQISRLKNPSTIFGGNGDDGGETVTDKKTKKSTIFCPPPPPPDPKPENFN